MADLSDSLVSGTATLPARSKNAAPRAKSLRPTKQESRLLDALRCWHESQPLGDCPLPELFRLLKAGAGRLTIGQFHDGLRSLLEKQVIYLHAWTGPLYEMPEPALALLAGHEIAYYVSLREIENPV